MIVTEAQVTMLRRGARIRVPFDHRPTVGEAYGAQLQAGARRVLSVTVLEVERVGTAWTALVIAGNRTDKPRFLKARPGKPGSGSGDYTTREALAMPDEPEPIDDTLQARLAHVASERDHTARAAAAKRPRIDPELLDRQRRVELALRSELDTCFQGWTPQDIARHAPHQGTIAEIRERRRAIHARAIDGYEPHGPAERAQWEWFLRTTGASVREIAKALDVSHRAAHELHQAWRETTVEAA